MRHDLRGPTRGRATYSPIYLEGTPNMNNLTTLMRSMTVLLFFVMVGASTAWAQTTYYAERNGIGATPCLQTAPCDVADAIAAATTADDIVAVRVREDGAMTRVDEGVTFGTNIVLQVWVEDGEEADTTGMIAIEGDVNLNAAVTVKDGVTLYLQGDVTVNSATAQR